MKPRTNRALLIATALAVFCTFLPLSFAWAAEDAAVQAKISALAPAADLASQADRYLKDLDEAVASEEGYKDETTKIARESNTLVLIALALGLHDEPSKYKDKAPAVMKAAQAVAAASDYAAAKKAVAELKAAVEGGSSAADGLKWQKVASLPELMKQVPIVNQKLRMNVKPARIKSKQKELAGYAAVIAVIGHGSIFDTSPAKNPEQAKQWQTLAAAMRDNAGALNAAIHKSDAAAAAKIMTKLNQDCEACHTAFNVKAVQDSSN